MGEPRPPVIPAPLVIPAKAGIARGSLPALHPATPACAGVVDAARVTGIAEAAHG